jgi:hypothetical protein
MPAEISPDPDRHSFIACPGFFKVMLSDGEPGSLPMDDRGGLDLWLLVSKAPRRIEEGKGFLQICPEFFKK